jgi:hypothetical protein
MHSMFEPFTSNYFLGRLYVEPVDRERAAIHRRDHRVANRRLYASGEGVERVDYPLVMKFDGHGAHFPVEGDESVPTGTLAVPADLTDGGRAGRQEVFLAAPERAGELLRYAGYRVVPRQAPRAAAGSTDGAGEGDGADGDGADGDGDSGPLGPGR